MPTVRGTRTCIVLMVVGLLLSTGPAGFTPPEAQAGFCAGEERAKIRYLFERLEQLTASGIKKFWFEAAVAVNAVKRIARYLPHFSLWWLQVQQRYAIIKLLQSAARGPEKLFDIKQLRAAVESSGKRAVRIQEYFLKWEPDAQPLFDATIASLTESWAVCQSIKTAGREPCKLLETIDPELEHKCIALMLRFGILYTGRCSSGKHRELMAKLIGEPPEKIGTICEILQTRQGDQCRSTMSSPLGIQICLALTGQGEAACKQTSLPEKIQHECLRDLYDYEVANGSRSLASWEQLNHPNSMLRAAALSAREPGDCVGITMWLYDRLDKSTEVLFLLRNQWYQPPGIP